MSTEPKFKVGDVVFNTRNNMAREVLFVGKDKYFFRLIETGHEDSSHIEFGDTNWYLKPQEITITKEQLAKAWDEVFAEGTVPSAAISIRFNTFCKELGFK